MNDLACVLVDGDHEYPVMRSDQAAWQASMDWARFHGIDPNRVPAGSYIERDAARRRILFSEFVYDGPGIGDIVLDGLDPLTVDRIKQGEAPPLPFPREATG